MLHYYAIIFLPLVSALLSGLLSRGANAKWACWLTSGGTIASAILSTSLFALLWVGPDETRQGITATLDLATWFGTNSLNVNWSLRFDSLSILMCFIITSVSSVVHVYSIGYMKDDPGIARFMAYLSYFTFAMLMLVTADNLIQLFFGWEGVGLASYLLIGFWHHKDSANKAAIKAFLVNRVGDVAFALGLGLIFIQFGSLNFTDIFEIAPLYANDSIAIFGLDINVITIIGILLTLGAMAKSAQIGLHTWLPDAMEGPTPVSALIHAATMVTAGIFLLCRMSPLIELSTHVLDFIVFVGATTAVFAATIALTQNDIKRVIAYSTCSQLGYMFVAVGLSAYPAAMFHLTTHAFFKALLFLGAGSVIHAMSNEQDMRKMGGLRKHIPQTYILMWVGTFALIGVIGLSGYYSKDLILEAAFVGERPIHHYAWWAAEITVLLTAFYSCRLMFMTFHGQERCDDATRHHIHESPAIMLVPLFILAVGAAGAGYLLHDFFSYDGYADGFWGSSLLILSPNAPLANVHHVPEIIRMAPSLFLAIGLFMAWLIYRHDLHRGAWIARLVKPLYLVSYNKWFVDELYHQIFVKPVFYIGNQLWLSGDKKIIDRFGPDGVSRLISVLARIYSFFHTGKIYHYAIVMIAGLIVFITVLFRF